MTGTRKEKPVKKSRSARTRTNEKRTVERDGNVILIKGSGRVRAVIRKEETAVILDDRLTHTSAMHMYSSNREAEEIIRMMTHLFF